MAANLLPRAFRKRVARQKTLMELEAARQQAELRDQQMTMNTMRQVSEGVGLANAAYGIADRVVPMFASKGDTKAPSLLTEDFTSASREARRGQAGAPAPTSQVIPGGAGSVQPPQELPPPQSVESRELDKAILSEELQGNIFPPDQVAPPARLRPVAPVPTRMPLAGGERAQRGGPESDWLVPGQEMEGVMDPVMQRAEAAGGVDPGFVGSGGQTYFEQGAPDLRKAGGRPQMPAPLAGMRFPSEIRYADGMKKVDEMMAQSELDLEGRTAEQLRTKLEQQRRGPLRSGIGNQSRPDVGGQSFAYPRGGAQQPRQQAQAPEGAQTQARPVAPQQAAAAAQPEQLPTPPWAGGAGGGDMVFERDQLRDIVGGAELRYGTYAETAAAIRDAAQRGDRDRVTALLMAAKQSPMRDVGPSSLREVVTGSHLDDARARLVNLGKIDPMLEWDRKKAEATARASGASADATIFNTDRGRQMLPDDLRDNKAKADINVDHARVVGALNDEKVAQAMIETDWRPRLHRSTLASQAEGRADSRNRRGWRNREKPGQILSRDQENFERATSQANAMGQQVNPYYEAGDGLVQEMTADDQREFLARAGRLPNVMTRSEIDAMASQGMPFMPEAPRPRPGAAPGRSINAATASAADEARQQREARNREVEDRNYELTRRREERKDLENVDRKERAIREASLKLRKALADKGLTKGSSGRNPSATRAAREAMDRKHEFVAEQAFNDLLRAGLTEAAARAEVEAMLRKTSAR